MYRQPNGRVQAKSRPQARAGSIPEYILRSARRTPVSIVRSMEAYRMTTYLIVVVVTAVANIWAAANDCTHPNWLLANMTKVGVARSSLVPLGVLKAAGGIGLLIGIAVPVVGLIAAAGLIVFFLGAIATHLRARDYSLGYGAPILFLLLAGAALVVQLDARGPA
jgi:DoxX-like family